MSSGHPQLGLSLTLRDDATLDNFYAGSAGNRLAVDTLRAECRRQGARVLFLHGLPGSGCTHLLQAACHAAAEQHWAAMYLPLEQFASENPDHVLSGLEALDLVCLDHLQAVAGKPSWEEALFHAMNRLHDAGRFLLVAADAPPAQLSIALPDVQTRLGAATVFRLECLDDESRLQLVKQRAASRGLVLDDEPARFLLSRAPRTTGALMDLLDTLDREALAQQRKLSIPFIKKIMMW